MTRLSAPRAECLVFTFKEGLLSPMAHDLKLRVERFEIEVDGEGEGTTFRATFDASSLRVVCAQREGRDAPSALSAAQRTEIEDNIRKDVLQARRYPEIRFRSTRVAPRGDDYDVDGTLELHGVRRALGAQVRASDGHLSAEVSLHQPDFGIKPYRAALGALRIKPAVRVRLTVPRDVTP